ncbi:hypothetical protein PENSPDRAFT_222021 [Peniophora sp. CONT]|nr:hypothetical protein PENSPDRAFT_222021 [Peniophora sp. CONT]
MSDTSFPTGWSPESSIPYSDADDHQSPGTEVFGVTCFMPGGKALAELKDALRAAGAVDLNPLRFNVEGKRCDLTMTMAHCQAFLGNHPEYQGVLRLVPMPPRLERPETLRASMMPSSWIIEHENTTRWHEARLSRHAKRGYEVLEKLRNALCAAGAKALTPLPSPHRGFKLKMTPLEKEAFLSGYHDRRMVSIMQVEEPPPPPTPPIWKPDQIETPSELAAGVNVYNPDLGQL